MTGLEKITEQIQEDARAAAAERIKEAQKSAEAILAEAKAACAALEVESDGKDAVMRRNYESRVKSAIGQQRRAAFLQMKQEIIAEVLGEAYAAIKNADVQNYFRTMEKLLKNCASAESGTISFSAKDLARMPSDFEKKIQAAAREKGGSLVLRKEPERIEDGFLLIYGGVEENCTLRAIFDAKREELQDRVNAILFS